MSNTVLPLALCALVVTVPLALAHQGATGPVKQRMDFMETMGEAMKALGDMLKVETAYDRATARTHARVLEEQALAILEQFPEGSVQPPSEARPIIWQEWPEFQEVAVQAQDESAELRGMLENGAERRNVLQQYAKLGRACGACHERFRERQG